MKNFKKLLAVALALTIVLSAVLGGASTQNFFTLNAQASVQKVLDDVFTTDAENIEEINTDSIVDNLNIEDSTVTSNDGDSIYENVVDTSVIDDNTSFAPRGEFNKGVVLIKVKKSFNSKDLGALEYSSAEPLYKGSKWYSVKLADNTKTEEAVVYLSKLGTFEKVDYD